MNVLSSCRALGVACTIALGAFAPVVGAVEQDGAPLKAFRVCKDPNNMPFANHKGEGFEDRIAELFARRLGTAVEYFEFPQRLGFIRNTLRFKLPDQDYPCDIVIGVPAEWDQVAPTKPYYRSTYVLVFAPSRSGLDSVNSAADFLALAPEKLATLKIGVFDRSPGSAWLARHNLVDSGVPYRTMNPNPDEYPGEVIERDLAQGVIDAAVIWGPIGAYFARRVSQPALRVVQLESEEGVRFDYAMAMGVRRGEEAWKKRIEGLIESNQAEISAILDDFGVPRLPLVAAERKDDGPRR